MSCNIQNSALEWSIIKRYTNAVYYYIIIIIYIAPVSSYLLNGAYVNNFDKSNSDVIKSGMPSSMRTCHKYNIM